MDDGRPARTSLARKSAYWFSVWFVLTAALMLFGVGLGSLIWMVVGTLAHSERTLGTLALDGADIGMQFTRVWAGGLAIVLCFIKAHEKFSCRDRFRRLFRR